MPAGMRPSLLSLCLALQQLCCFGFCKCPRPLIIERYLILLLHAGSWAPRLKAFISQLTAAPSKQRPLAIKLISSPKQLMQPAQLKQQNHLMAAASSALDLMLLAPLYLFPSMVS